MWSIINNKKFISLANLFTGKIISSPKVSPKNYKFIVNDVRSFNNKIFHGELPFKNE